MSLRSFFAFEVQMFFEFEYFTCFMHMCVKKQKDCDEKASRVFFSENLEKILRRKTPSIILIF